MDSTSRDLFSAVGIPRRRAILCGAMAAVLAVVGWMSQVAHGQQVYPPNGLLVFADAGRTLEGPAEVSVDTSRGSLHTLSVAITRDASARIAPGAAGRADPGQLGTSALRPAHPAPSGERGGDAAATRHAACHVRAV